MKRATFLTATCSIVRSLESAPILNAPLPKFLNSQVLKMKMVRPAEEADGL